MTREPTDVRTVLAAALRERAEARPYRPEDNPLAGQSLADLTRSRSVRRHGDLRPAVDPATVTDPTPLGLALEAARTEGLRQRAEDRSARRTAVARARAARKAQLDALVDSPVPPDPARLAEAWRVVVPLVPIIDRVASSRARWAGRFLGSLADDVPQQVVERTVLVLARSDRDLGLLARAADELGEAARRTGRVPGDQAVSDDERAERRAVSRARKWLMGLVNNRVMGALADAYASQRNLRWENIDLVATVMASISGVGEDPLLATSRADRAPALLGARFPRPGHPDPTVLVVAISAAVSDRGLDPLVELLLDEENRRTDGAVRWADCAERVFRLTPGGLGGYLWDQVVAATEHLEVPRRARADAARTHVRNLFSWLPGLVVAVLDAQDVARLGSVDGRAVVASGLDDHRRDRLDEERLAVARPGQLRPCLTYASPEDAARALVEHLSVLVTGADYAASLAHA